MAHGEAHLEGVDRVIAALQFMIESAGAATPIAVDNVLKAVARHERAQLSLGWHPPGTKTGSQPGQPPWRITGRLSRAVTVQPAALHGPWRWSGKTGPDGAKAIYARIHELGGWTGAGYRTYLPPRPHLKPAWEIVRPTVRPSFKRVWTRATRPPTARGEI